MKVSYKGVTGALIKLERGHVAYHTLCFDAKIENPATRYTLEIEVETDGHKHVFENVDVSEIKFIGAVVTIA